MSGFDTSSAACGVQEQRLTAGTALAVLDSAMVLKIELQPSASETVFMLIGRITSPDVQQLKARIAEMRNAVALDLQQVDLVDLDAVYFLAAAERSGIELRHLPRYVREWIHLERRRVSDLEGDGPLPMTHD